MALFVCKSDLHLKTVCANIQAEYNLPLFVFDEHNTWEYAISHREGIGFNVTKTERLDTLMTWGAGTPDNVNYHIIVSITTNEYSTQNIKGFLERMLLTDIIEIQNIGSWNFQNNFTNHDDFDKYVQEQDRWIYHWSLPEHGIFAYMLEKSAKYKGGEIVEYISMSRNEHITYYISYNPLKYISVNHISVSHVKGKQSHEIWSGYVDSPNEYQVMMSAINEFIEEYKNNSGAT